MRGEVNHSSHSKKKSHIMGVFSEDLTFKCPEVGTKTKDTEIGNNLAIYLQKKTRRNLASTNTFCIWRMSATGMELGWNNCLYEMKFSKEDGPRIDRILIASN